ncbi:MAG: helix-turn-helix domain-containing protein [Nitrospiraceae bacterium]
MVRAVPLNLLLVTSDADLQAQVKRTFKEATVTHAKEVGGLSRLLPKKRFDVALVEGTTNAFAEPGPLKTIVDSHKTLVVAGSRQSLQQAIQFLHAWPEAHNGQKSNGYVLSLEELIESKVGDFVRGMRHGSAKNLYPVLMSAVERPLLTHALKETNGNQIQAARLLGMNRNTLRKKITALHIVVSRTKSVQTIAS